MGKELNGFDEQLRSAMNAYEAPYDEKVWQGIESHLDLSSASNGGNAVWVALLSGAALVAASLALWVFVGIESPEGLILKRTAKLEQGLSYEGILHKMESGQVHQTAQLPEAEKPLVIIAQNQKNKTRKVVAPSPKKKEMEVQRAIEDKELNSSDKDYKKNENVLVFAASQRETCVGNEISFDLSTGEMMGSYLWNFGDGNFSSKPNPTHAFKQPGMYDISLSITSAEDGVMRSRSIENMVLVNPTPKASFDWEFVNGANELPTVKFINTSDQAENCVWEFGSGDYTEVINPTNIYSKAGKHAVKLTVSNAFGCEDSFYNYVNITSDFNLGADKTLSVEKAAAGKAFMPEVLRLNDYNFKLTVYNGKQPIFETKDKTKGWNAMLPNGNPAQLNASYPWVVIIYDEFNEEQDYYSGSVTIEP